VLKGNFEDEDEDEEDFSSRATRHLFHIEYRLVFDRCFKSKSCHVWPDAFLMSNRLGA
jgi:hypothetical protein